MARYKYSENTKEVTDIYFDTETHGEFMGMEQDGEMKKVSLPLLQAKIVEEITGDLNSHEADTTNPHEVTKEQVGLDEVDNTSDADKPISTAQQTALNLKETVANVNALKGTGWTDETVKGNADDITTLNADDSTEGSVAYDIKQSSDALKGVGYTEGTIKTHEDRLDTLEGADTVEGSVAKTVKDAVDEVAGEIDTLNAGAETEGSVLKTINDTAQDATYDNSTSGLTAETLGGAIDEVEGRVDAAEGEIDDLQTAETAIKGNGWTDENLVDHEDRLDTLEGDDTVVGSVAKTVKDAVDLVKGTGWTGETVKGNAEDIEAHKEASMPHIFHNLKTGKTYKYGFQLSAEGNPQTIYEEMI